MKSIDRRDVIGTVCAFIGTAALAQKAGKPTVERKKSERPNILFLLLTSTALIIWGLPATLM